MSREYLDYLHRLYVEAIAPPPGLPPEKVVEAIHILMENARPILDEIAHVEALRPPPPPVIMSDEEFDKHFTAVLPDSKGG